MREQVKWDHFNVFFVVVRYHNGVIVNRHKYGVE